MILLPVWPSLSMLLKRPTDMDVVVGYLRLAWTGRALDLGEALRMPLPNCAGAG